MDSLWGLLKWVYVLGFSIYVLFALVVAAQVRQMVTALNGHIDKVIKFIGLIHLLVAVGALLLAIVLL